VQRFLARKTAVAAGAVGRKPLLQAQSSRGVVSFSDGGLGAENVNDFVFRELGGVEIVLLIGDSQKPTLDAEPQRR